MTTARPSISLLFLVALATTTQVHAATTRAEVQADYAAAVQRGDVLAGGDIGMKLNELYPRRYAPVTAPDTTTRAQVRAELAQAIRSGDLVASGDGGRKLNEELPQRYPAVAIFASTTTRAQVKAETVAAIRSGDMIASGEGTMRLNEEFPRRYAQPAALYAGGALSALSVAAAPASR